LSKLETFVVTSVLGFVVDSVSGEFPELKTSEVLVALFETEDSVVDKPIFIEAVVVGNIVFVHEWVICSDVDSVVDSVVRIVPTVWASSSNGGLLTRINERLLQGPES